MMGSSDSSSSRRVEDWRGLMRGLGTSAAPDVHWSIVLLLQGHEGVDLPDVDLETLARFHDDAMSRLAINNNLEWFLKRNVSHEPAIAVGKSLPTSARPADTANVLCPMCSLRLRIPEGVIGHFFFACSSPRVRRVDCHVS